MTGSPTVEESKKETITEKLPEKLIRGLAEAGFNPNQVLTHKSYPAQKIWVVVAEDENRHPKLQISFDGKWLNPPPPPKKKAKR
jgi:hypothetical protein